MGQSFGLESADDLESEEIHHVLGNRRRRRVLDILQDADGPIGVRELSERIGTIESGEEPPPRNVKQSVYVSLLQTHLPKLDELGIIDYEVEGRMVSVGDGLDEVAVYLETVEPYGLSWAEYNAALALLGALIVAGAELGTPVVTAIPPVAWAYGFLGLVFLSSVYQTARQGSSILHRHLA